MSWKKHWIIEHPGSLHREFLKWLTIWNGGSYTIKYLYQIQAQPFHELIFTLNSYSYETIVYLNYSEVSLLYPRRDWKKKKKAGWSCIGMSWSLHQCTKRVFLMFAKHKWEKKNSWNVYLSKKTKLTTRNTVLIGNQGKLFLHTFAVILNTSLLGVLARMMNKSYISSYLQHMPPGLSFGTVKLIFFK